jgi:hypothetical protein
MVFREPTRTDSRAGSGPRSATRAGALIGVAPRPSIGRDGEESASEPRAAQEANP